MDWMQWFLVIFGGTFILTLIILGSIIMYKLRKKKYVFGTIFLKSGGQQKILIKRDSSKTTLFENCVYTFNEMAVRKTAWKDFIYYKEGISSPLTFNNVEVQANMTPEELKIILEDDLLKQLFSDSQMETLKILIIICLITGIITLLVLVLMMFKGVTIKDNEANRLFLMNVTRTVLVGG